MEGKDKVEWLESILRDKRNKATPNRSAESSALLSMAAAKMEANRKKLQIPGRYIVIMRYLADNPRAVIIADANVTKAFAYAREVMML